MNNESPFRAHPIVTATYNPRVGIRLPWNMVGVHDYRGLDYGKVLTVPKKDITGKCIVSGGIVTEWQKGLFMSKYDD